MEENKSLFDQKIDFQTSAETREMSRWIKMLGVMMLILPGLLILFCLVGWNKIGYLFTEELGNVEGGSNMVVGMLLVVVLILAAVLGLLAFFLIRGGKRLYAGVRTKDQQSFNAGLSDIKSFLIIYGVITLLGFLMNLISFIR